MKLNTSLAIGVVALLTGGNAALAQDAPKPAASASADAPEKIQKVLGTYKSETPGVPVITLAWEGGKLMMKASGYPALEVTLGEKGALKSTVLPEAFKFNLVLDADGKATAIKMETPMGGGELKRLPGKPTEEAKKDEIPDILGVYEPTEKVEGAHDAEVVFEKGKLWVKIEGQPPFSFTLGKDDKLIVEPALPEGTTIKLVRNADGKVVGSEYAGPDGTVKFKRKMTAAKSAFPDVLGKYEADDAASPIPGGEMVIEGGTLILRVDGQPDFPVKIDKDGNILSDKFPEGVTSKLRKDKDGKITGMDAETPLGKIGFTRKTFVPLPGAAKEDPKLARYKEIAGTYKAEMEGLPTITLSVKDGKLVLQAEGQPAIEGDLTKDDKLTADQLPAGFELKITRDKDGKVTGLHADTPMGSADFKFTPEKKADK